MQPFNCANYCDDVKFMKSINNFDLSLGPHCETEEKLNTLVNALSSAGDSLNMYEIVSCLINNSPNSEITREVRGLYVQGTKLEYGKHRNLMNGAIFSVVGILAALSKIFDIEIYAVCGSLPLLSIRKSSPIIRFKFQNSDSRKIVVGIVGLSIFHSIVQPTLMTSSIWSNLNAESIIINPESFIEYFPSLNPMYNDRIDDEEELNDERTIGIQADPQILNVSEDNGLEEWDLEFHELVSMDEFVNRYSSVDQIGERTFSCHALSNEAKIDIIRTSVLSLDSEEITRIEQVVDIDGFFGFFKIEDSTVFKGNVKMLRRPSFKHDRELNTFHKCFLDSGKIVETNPVIMKFGTATMDYGIFDLFLAFYPQTQGLGSFNLKVVEDCCATAFQLAMNARCRQRGNGQLIHPNCKGVEHRENIDAYRSAINISTREYFDNDRLNCFLFHFRSLLINELFHKGILVVNLFCYVQCVGTKFTMFAPSVNGIYHSVEKIRYLFNVDLMECFYDICFSSIAHCSTEAKKLCLFWNSDELGELRRDLGPGLNYPQLFCASISNIHSNKAFGHILKRNLYSSTIDLMQADRPNRPIKFLNIARRILTAFNNLHENDLLKEIIQIYKELNAEIVRVTTSLESNVTKSGAVRAEFRISHERLASIVTVLNDVFSPINVFEKTIPISTQTVAKYSSFWVHILSQPITAKLSELCSRIEDMDIEKIPGIISVISAFESLLTYSFFSGSTLSYARELIWANGAAASTKSFKLGESIKKLNRPYFNPLNWDFDNLNFDSEEVEYFEKTLVRLGSSNKGIDTLKLFLLVKNCNVSDVVKAKELWKAYFNEIPESDFVSKDCLKWKISSLNSEPPAKFSNNRLSIEDSIEKIFNRTMIGRGQWNRGYLKAFDLWCKGSVKHEILISYLVKAAEILGIEMIRYHTITDSFFSNGKEYQLIGKNVVPVPLINEHVKRGHELILNEINNDDNRKKAKGSAYTIQENIDLIRGVNQFGTGNWAVIAKSSELCFRITGRDGVSLKDRFRNLKNLETEGKLYFLPNYKSECIQPIRLKTTASDFNIEGRGIVFEIASSGPIMQLNNSEWATSQNIIEHQSAEHFIGERILNVEGITRTESVLNITTIQTHSNIASIYEDRYDEIFGDLGMQSSGVDQTIFSPSLPETHAKDLIRKIFNENDTDILLGKIYLVPETFNPDFKNSKLFKSLPSRFRSLDIWKLCFNELLAENLLEMNELNHLRRRF